MLVGHKPGHGKAGGRAGGGLLSRGGGLGRNEIVDMRHRGDVIAYVIGLLGFLDADLGDGFGAEHAGDGLGVERRAGWFALLVVGVPGAKEGVDEAGHLLHQELVADVEGDEEREARLDLEAVGCRRRFAQGEFPLDEGLPSRSVWLMFFKRTLAIVPSTIRGTVVVTSLRLTLMFSGWLSLILDCWFFVCLGCCLEKRRGFGQLVEAEGGTSPGRD